MIQVFQLRNIKVLRTLYIVVIRKVETCIQFVDHLEKRNGSFWHQKASISSRWRLQRGIHILAQLEGSIYCKPGSMLTPAKKVVLFMVLRLRVVSRYNYLTQLNELSLNFLSLDVKGGMIISQQYCERFWYWVEGGIRRPPK